MKVIVTTFTAGQQTTLPIWMLSELIRPRQRPITNVVAVFIICITKQSLSIEKGKWSFVQDEDWCYIGSSPIKSDLPDTNDACSFYNIFIN